MISNPKPKFWQQDDYIDPAQGSQNFQFPSPSNAHARWRKMTVATFEISSDVISAKARARIGGTGKMELFGTLGRIYASAVIFRQGARAHWRDGKWKFSEPWAGSMLVVLLPKFWFWIGNHDWHNCFWMSLWLFLGWTFTGPKKASKSAILHNKLNKEKTPGRCCQSGYLLN